MIKDSRLPGKADKWLHTVQARLADLDPGQREELVDGFRSHIQESIDAGGDVDAVLAELGSPGAVAADALKAETPGGPRYLNAKRVLQIVGVVLTVAAAAVMSVLPSFESVTTDSSGHEKIETQTLLEVQGIAFLIVLLIPVLVAAVPLFLRGRAWQVTSIVVAAALALFVILGALSIGRFYLPAAIIEIVAIFVPVRRHNQER